jgi:hypothetical protein
LFDFNKDPGDGNLNARAYFASLVGPRRTAFGKSEIKRILPAQGVLLQLNNSRAHECMYVECRLPAQTPDATPMLFSSQQDAIGETGVLTVLSTAIFVPGLGGGTGALFYGAVLLPGDQLYAQLAPIGGVLPVRPVSLNVITVTF